MWIVKCVNYLSIFIAYSYLFTALYLVLITIPTRYPTDFVDGDEINTLAEIITNVAKVSGHFKHSPQKTTALNKFVKISSNATKVSIASVFTI